MIPQRILNGVNFGNGVRIRVSARRKRLRVARAAHRTDSDIPLDQQSTTPVANVGIPASNSADVATSSLQEEAERA